MITVVANLKGGTGKSTVAFNLAVWLRSNGFGVRVIDLDPQRNLIDVASLRLHIGGQPSISVQSGPLLDVNLLSDAQETLIDVGTADIKSFKLALRIADRVLIPVTPSQADIWSTQYFVQLLDRVSRGRPPESLAFINRADVSRAIPHADETAAALESLPVLRVLPQRLFDRMVFRNSFSEGLAVFELEPRGKASGEFNALAEAVYGGSFPDNADGARKDNARSSADSIFGQNFDASQVMHPILSGGGHGQERTGASSATGKASAGKAKGKKKKEKAGKGKQGKKDRKGKVAGKAARKRKSKKAK